jgi:hypothetical protein
VSPYNENLNDDKLIKMFLTHTHTHTHTHTNTHTHTHISTRRCGLDKVFGKLSGDHFIKPVTHCDYNITPLIRINWDDEPSGYAENPYNLIFCLKID